MYQIIIRHKANLSIHNLTQQVTMIGPNAEADIKISHLPISLSLIIEESKVKFVPLGTERIYRSFKEWGDQVGFGDFWGNEDLQFVVMEKKDTLTNSTIKDWDFSALPKNPQKKTYPEEVLSFIKSSLKISQVALFKRSHNLLTVIASDGLVVQDKTSFLLNTLIEENLEKTLIEVQYNTHSLIFKDPNNISNYTLIRNSISPHTDLVLYITNPNQSLTHVPMGVLASLAFLFSHGLSLYLAFQKNAFILRDIEEKDIFFWGKNPEMQRSKKIIDRILFNDLSILVLGETGTGKEMIARYFAQKSGKKLISINCATIPKDLAESYFFGHKKGSFTGAIHDQTGKIQEAHGGILFLDEIGELTLDLQAKLLSVLQDKKVTPIAGKEEKVQFQLICATHRNLEEMVAKQTFREDLYYRINEMSVHLPPLRERREDIIDLSHYLLDELHKEYKISLSPLSLKAQDFILNYSWQGNIRELKSLLKKSLLLNEGPELELILIKDQKKIVKKDLNLERAKDQFLRNHIREALMISKNNKTEAAKLLNIPVRSLFRIISSHDHDKNDMAQWLSD